MKKHNQSGFTGVDALIAIGVILLFTGLIITISYNIYLASMSANRISRATYYIVSVFEFAEVQPFPGVASEDFPDGRTDAEYAAKLAEYFNRNHINIMRNNSQVQVASANAYFRQNDEWVRVPNVYGSGVNTPYTVSIRVERFEPTDDPDPIDLIRIIEITVNYRVGNREQDLTMTRIVQR